MYGSGRIGQYRREGNAFAYVYELKDHVGSVRALLWQNEASSTASIYSFSDYYPYGLRMQNFNDLTYRYGYQGEYSEYDQDTKLNHFQLRDYDPVIGRWTGIDPYREFYSGYVGMGNNPVSETDPDGGDTNDDVYKNSNSSSFYVVDTNAPDRYFLDGALQEGYTGPDGSWRNYIGPNETYHINDNKPYFQILKEDYDKLASGNILGFLFPDDDRMSFGFGGSTKVAGVVIKGAGKLPSYYAAFKASMQGGLNLFKWGAGQTGNSTGWKVGDYMLHLPNKGTPALNWKANYGALRSEMNLGKPIFDSYRLSNGTLVPTNGFLNAERSILQGRGWIYNSSNGAWMPPGF